MILKTKFDVPTGQIFIAQGDHGLLEFLSLGDYGKAHNVKADFMGLTRPIDGVSHGDLLPLSEKWVVTVSSQYGCSSRCAFCDVPKVGRGRNATFPDLVSQVRFAIAAHPDVAMTKRLNLHYARMGEPTYNWEVINSAVFLAGQFRYRGWGFHPVLSTMMPRAHTDLREYLIAWMHLKNVILSGNAGLQLSINSTDDKAREFLFGESALSLAGVAHLVDWMKVLGRKVALNFAVSEYPIEGDVLARYFDPSKFMCKITPMHKTCAAEAKGIRTHGGYDSYYPYETVEADLKKHGYDVLVFVPSLEEDLGRITCGNAILSGSRPEIPHNRTDYQPLRGDSR